MGRCAGVRGPIWDDSVPVADVDMQHLKYASLGAVQNTELNCWQQPQWQYEETTIIGQQGRAGISSTLYHSHPQFNSHFRPKWPKSTLQSTTEHITSN